MRLSPYQKQAIIASFQKYFSPDDHLWLFGSRVDMSRKGGDIDLYIETKEKNARLILERKISFISAIELAIGEQKIDVVVNNGEENLLIYQEARLTGVKLL